MRLRDRLAVPTALFGAATAGLVAGHEIGYRLLAAAGHKHDILIRSAHSYLRWAFILSWAAITAAGAVAFVLGYRRDRDAAQDGTGRIALRLAVTQTISFVALELIERMVAGVPLDRSALLVVVAGLAVEVVVAFAGAALLALLRRAGEILAHARRRRAPVAPLPFARRPIRSTPRARFAGAFGSRSPPGAHIRI